MDPINIIERKKDYYQKLDNITGDSYTPLLIQLYRDYLDLPKTGNALSDGEIIHSLMAQELWPLICFYFQIQFPLDEVYSLIEKEKQIFIKKPNETEVDPIQVLHSEPLTPTQTYSTLISFPENQAIAFLKDFASHYNLGLHIADTIISHDEEAFLHDFLSLDVKTQMLLSKIVSYYKERVPIKSILEDMPSFLQMSTKDQEVVKEVALSLLNGQQPAKLQGSNYDAIFDGFKYEIKKYNCNINILDNHERNIIERLLKHPNYICIYNDAYYEYNEETKAMSKTADTDFLPIDTQHLPKAPTNKFKSYGLPSEIVLYKNPNMNGSEIKGKVPLISDETKQNFLNELASILSIHGCIEETEKDRFVFAFGGKANQTNPFLKINWKKTAARLIGLCYALYDKQLTDDRAWPKIMKLFLINGKAPNFSNRNDYEISSHRNFMQNLVQQALRKAKLYFEKND